jgi:hypothetical protein
VPVRLPESIRKIQLAALTAGCLGAGAAALWLTFALLPP